eukprot:TRINITY_DN1696_c0_g1_i1.p2 TRINITY_DN1696_c0_g1~~TRINITY_DN1696_c0_g1_i1.p2  ORF type:complete len:223 (-),score=32.58 TRINITY_DN1696_c0_g1_i1:137-805(-)
MLKGNQQVKASRQFYVFGNSTYNKMPAGNFTHSYPPKCKVRMLNCSQFNKDNELALTIKPIKFNNELIEASRKSKTNNSCNVTTKHKDVKKIALPSTYEDLLQDLQRKFGKKDTRELSQQRSRNHRSFDIVKTVQTSCRDNYTRFLETVITLVPNQKPYTSHNNRRRTVTIIPKAAKSKWYDTRSRLVIKRTYRDDRKAYLPIRLSNLCKALFISKLGKATN